MSLKEDVYKRQVYALIIVVLKPILLLMNSSAFVVKSPDNTSEISISFLLSISDIDYFLNS